MSEMAKARVSVRMRIADQVRRRSRDGAHVRANAPQALFIAQWSGEMMALNDIEPLRRLESGRLSVAIETGREIHTSTNGDRWLLLRDLATGHSFVRHTGNPASGGHVSDISLPTFLGSGRDGPEHQELWRMIGALADSEPTQPPAAALILTQRD